MHFFPLPLADQEGKEQIKWSGAELLVYQALEWLFVAVWLEAEVRVCGQAALGRPSPTLKQLSQLPRHRPLYSRLCLRTVVGNKGRGSSLLSLGSHEPLRSPCLCFPRVSCLLTDKTKFRKLRQLPV